MRIYLSVMFETFFLFYFGPWNPESQNHINRTIRMRWPCAWETISVYFSLLFCFLKQIKNYFFQFYPNIIILSCICIYRYIFLHWISINVCNVCKALKKRKKKKKKWTIATRSYLTYISISINDVKSYFKIIRNHNVQDKLIEFSFIYQKKKRFSQNVSIHQSIFHHYACDNFIWKYQDIEKKDIIVFNRRNMNLSISNYF